eukprot:2089739-Prymnesium_polylepis.1
MVAPSVGFQLRPEVREGFEQQEVVFLGDMQSGSVDEIERRDHVEGQDGDEIWAQGTTKRTQLQSRASEVRRARRNRARSRARTQKKPAAQIVPPDLFPAGNPASTPVRRILVCEEEVQDNVTGKEDIDELVDSKHDQVRRQLQIGVADQTDFEWCDNRGEHEAKKSYRIPNLHELGHVSRVHNALVVLFELELHRGVNRQEFGAGIP